MKRIVICYDGTWNAVTDPTKVTNVVRLGQAVRKTAKDGTAQTVYYNAGVGSGGPLDRFLGGVFGLGLRNNVKRGLAFLSLNWEPGDEIYLFGFSRGCYTVRVLALASSFWHSHICQCRNTARSGIAERSSDRPIVRIGTRFAHTWQQLRTVRLSRVIPFPLGRHIYLMIQIPGLIA
jgi:hypothetical protein